MKELKSIIESVLFINGEPISENELSKGLCASKDEVKKALDLIKEEYSQRGINLLKLNDGYQFCTNPKHEKELESFFKPIKKSSLSQSALETLSIIAYKQPITKMEIEQIRGVKCAYVLNYLKAHDLIKSVGKKKTLGRPSLYATTLEFLRIVGISSLKDLPKIESAQQVFKDI